MSDIKDLTDRVIKFRDQRDWKQFHNPKDAAIAMTLEVSELLEHFQWRNEEEVREHIRKYKKELGEELADVLFWVLLMSHDLKIDIKKASEEKIKHLTMSYLERIKDDIGELNTQLKNYISNTINRSQELINDNKK